MGDTGIILIGRNEGQRLVEALQACVNQGATLIYVDSGSTDNSIENARRFNADIVELDLSIPFTAARARNDGFNRLMKLYPGTKFVQFIDGDCQLVDQWLSRAIDFLKKNSDVALVCGRRFEKYPQKTIYNALCDFEWNTPVGEAKACGGDFLIRASVFSTVNGFNPALIAGEEPEMGIRIRQLGWKIHRIDEDMTRHDANILHFQQWWKRSVRTGHAFIEGAWMHGNAPEKHWVKETIRAAVWGGMIPVLILFLSILNPFSMLLLIIYPLQFLRLSIKSGNPAFAFFSVVGKFAEFYGELKFIFNKIFRKQASLVEYK